MSEPLHVIIDTREQTPWAFPEWLATATRGTLQTGDYALAGDDGFAIERKSINDLCGTVATGWDRFLREIERMDGWPAKVVIVEGNLSSLFFGDDGRPPEHDHWRLTPAFLKKRVIELVMMGVCVLFVENPDYGAAMALEILKQRKNANDQGN